MGNNDPAPMKPFCSWVTAYSSAFLYFSIPLNKKFTWEPQFTSPHVDLPPLTLRSVHDNDSTPFQLSLTFLSLDSCSIKQQTPASSSTLGPGLAGSTEIPWGFHCPAFLWHFYSSSLEHLRWYQTEIWLRKKSHTKSMPCALGRLTTGRLEM